MPIHDLGYRGWQGPLVPAMLRWLVIAETGIRLSWKNGWLRRIVLFAWLPAAYMAILFFMFEQVENNQQVMPLVAGYLNSTATGAKIQPSDLPRDKDESRHLVWGVLLLMFFRNSQGVAMVVLFGLIAPALIANDVRSRAFLLYFSRPLGRGEYILGKLWVLWAYGLMITTLPALGLYLLAVVLSPSLDVVAYTWDLPLRVLGASLVLLIPTSTMALAFSSLAKESRYASFAWFGVWILGWAAYVNISVALRSTQRMPPPELTLLSPYHTLGKVQTWVFGVQEQFTDVLAPAILLTAVTVVSLAIIYRRVSSPMRA